MEDKFLDGMVDASITMMKRLSEGGTLTPDELKFILLTKQMSEKANKQNKSNPLGGLLEGSTTRKMRRVINKFSHECRTLCMPLTKNWQIAKMKI